MKYDGNSLYFIMGPYIYILFQFFFFFYILLTVRHVMILGK